jgi:hypothetical protein
MTTTLIPASDKQISFVNDLMATREVTPDEMELFAEIIECGLDKHNASMIIDTLIKRAKVAKSKSGLSSILSTIPKSKYAVPVA